MNKTMSQLLAAVLFLGMAGAVSAQNPGAAPPPEAPPAAPQGQSQSIDGETIDKFAQAYGEVVSLQQEFVEELNGLENQDGAQEKAQELQMEAQEAMAQAVQDAGLSIDEYNNVVVAMDSDPELKEEVMNQVDQ